MKNSNQSIGNRSRNLPSYSVVSQSNAPPRASNNLPILIYIHISTQLHVSATDVHRHGDTNMFKTYPFTIKFVVLK